MVDHGFHPSEDASSGQEERIAKALARAGVASRREVERLIEAGRVALNGVVLTTPAVKVKPGDILTVDGQVVDEAEPTRVWRYHKPVGLLTSHNDPKGRPTVFENLPPGLPRVISIGRLDLSSEGLLILTNDGGLARALELPASGLVRRYRARARGRITQERLDKLKDGITVEGVRYGGIEAKLDKAKEGGTGANLWITLTLAEGKNREVRKVLEALGVTVNRLIRLAYGPFQLGDLGPGQAEEIGPRVIREQLADYIAPENMPSGDRQPKPIAKPAAKSRQQRPPPTVGEEKPDKPAYKPGWARAKKKISPHAAPKKFKPKPDSTAVISTKGGPSGRRGARPAPTERAERPKKSYQPKPDSTGISAKGGPSGQRDAKPATTERTERPKKPFQAKRDSTGFSAKGGPSGHRGAKPATAERAEHPKKPFQPRPDSTAGISAKGSPSGRHGAKPATAERAEHPRKPFQPARGTTAERPKGKPGGPRRR